MYCLYQITNLVNGKFYIGVHQDAANVAYMGSGVSIQRAIKKYGRDYFKRDILAECPTKAFAYQLEAAIVNEAFVARQDTYNMRLGGEHSCVPNGGAPFGSHNHLGWKHPYKSRPSTRGRDLGNWTGRKHTQESKEKMRRAKLSSHAGQ
jgi:hypothetical protein